jgi:tight adherence protein B
MKILGVDLQMVKLIAMAAVVLALAIATFAVGNDPAGLPRRYWNRYIAFLGRQLRRMFIFSPPETIAYGQIAGVFLCFALGLLAELPLWWMFALAVLVLPVLYIEQMRKKRVEQIEDQIDGFILALANALKSTPSIGDAFKSIAVIIPAPLKQEIELANKEMRVGSTLDQALLLMASRVGSRQLDTALSAILVGRQVGDSPGADVGSVAQHGRAVTDGEHFIHPVRDEDDRHPGGAQAAHLLKQSIDFALGQR